MYYSLVNIPIFLATILYLSCLSFKPFVPPLTIFVISVTDAEIENASLIFLNSYQK